MKQTVKQNGSSATTDDHIRSDSSTMNDSDIKSFSSLTKINEIVNTSGNSNASEVTTTKEKTSSSNINNAGVDVNTKTDISFSEDMGACGIETDSKTANATNTMIYGDITSVNEIMGVSGGSSTFRSLSLSTLSSMSTLGTLSSSGSVKPQSTVLALSRVLNRSHYISRWALYLFIPPALQLLGSQACLLGSKKWKPSLAEKLYGKCILEVP